MIEPAIAAHHGRIVKRTGDGFIAEFRSVVDAAHCAIEVQTGMVERNAGVTPDRRIEFRIGIHLGDVVKEADGDLMGDGVNIASRLEGLCAADGGNSFVADPAAAFAAAEAKLTKALSSFPNHTHGRAFLGYVEILTKRALEGIAECEHALALDRNLADAHAYIGLGKIFTGRAEEAEAHIGEALRLSPRDPSAYVWLTEAGIAKNHLGDCEQAVLWCRRAIEANRNYPEAHFHLAAALARLGRLDAARSAVTAGLALNPTFTISRALINWTAMSDDPAHPLQLAPIFEGLRIAGLPEQ